MVNLKKVQSGRSMIEMLGVLAIVGVLSAGGIAGYSMAMQSYKTTQLIERVNLIATRTRQVYKGYYTYTHTNPENMVSSGKLSASDFENPFGGQININGSGWEDNRVLFEIQLSNLPAETCTDLLLTDWGSVGMFEGVYMESDAVRRLRYKTGNWPVEAADAITYCASGATKFHMVFR